MYRGIAGGTVVEQAEKLVQCLKNAGKPHKFVVRDDNVHGRALLI